MVFIKFWWISLKGRRCFITFSRIFEIAVSRFVLREFAQNFIHEALTIKNIIDKIFVFIAFQGVLFYFWSFLIGISHYVMNGVSSNWVRGLCFVQTSILRDRIP